MHATNRADHLLPPVAATAPVVPSDICPLDAFDCPAILLGNDGAQALETRSVLQSLGFDVFCGADLGGGDEEPVLVVLSDYLDRPQNRQRFARIQARWPFAPVIRLGNPADAVVQLAPVIS